MWSLVVAIGIIVPGGIASPLEAFSGKTAILKDRTIDIEGAGTQGIRRSNLPWNSSAESDETNQPGDPTKLDQLQWVWFFEWTWVNGLEMSCAFVGILGNLLVILALRMQVGVNKHSTDIFIGALAVSDLVTSISILPLPLAVRVPLTPVGSLYCKFAYTRFFMWVPVHMSIYTLVGIAIERTIAVVSPLHFRSYVTTRKIYSYISAVCVFSFTSCLYTAEVTVVNSSCRFLHKDKFSKTIMFYLLMIRFFFPVTIMIVTQSVTAWSLHRQSLRARKGLSQASSVSSTHIRARNRMARLTLLVVLTYILTFAPPHMTALVYVLQRKLKLYVRSPLHSAVSVLICVNSCANPFICASQYPRFRAAIRSVFKCKRADSRKHFFSTVEKSYNTENVHNQ